jgi:hypothetical protein
MYRNTGIVLSRRGWMALAGAGVFGDGLFGANTDFWNKKDHSAWTEDEIQILLTKSPWAKEGLLMPKPGARGSSGGNLGADGVGVDGIGLGVGGRQERQEGRTTAPPTAEGVVVWESAQAILDARKRPLSKEFRDHYTLSVRGVPWRWEGDKSFDQWRQFTTLQPNDQPPVQPGTVQKAVGDPGAVLLGFSKDVLVLSANDRSIHFTTEVGQTVLKTKFDTKEMRYQGRLAL